MSKSKQRKKTRDLEWLQPIPLIPERTALWCIDLCTTPAKFLPVLKEMTSGDGKFFRIENGNLVAHFPEETNKAKMKRPRYHEDRWRNTFFREYARAELEVTGDPLAVILRVMAQIQQKAGPGYGIVADGLAKLLDVDIELVQRTLEGMREKGLIHASQIAEGK